MITAGVLHLVFWAAGVAEVEFTFVITVQVHRVVGADRWDQEASGSWAEVIEFIQKDMRQGVDPLRRVSSRVLVVAHNLRQASFWCLGPHLHLQASSTWINGVASTSED